MPQEQQPITPERILQFTFAFGPPLILEAAIRHRMFDVLDSGPRTISELAKETGASERGLFAIAGALVALDLLSRDAQNRYALTPESSAFLVSTKPAFQGGLMKHVSTRLLPSWMHLSEVVASGKPSQAVNDTHLGEDFFAGFVADLFPLNFAAATTVAAHLKLGGQSAPRVLDLAAGSGVWSIALAQSAPSAQVTAVDLPGVLKVTEQFANRFGVGERYTYVPGDILETDFGSGYTIATLGHILHSEGPARSRELIRRVFEALAPGGTIVVAEYLVNAEHTGPTHSALFAVNMLVNTENGTTYSFEEINEWLEKAGFTDARTLSVPAPSPLILATRPSEVAPGLPNAVVSARPKPN